MKNLINVTKILLDTKEGPCIRFTVAYYTDASLLNQIDWYDR